MKTNRVSRSVLTVVAAAWAVGLCGIEVCAAGDVGADFERLYGPRIKAVTETGSTRDDVALAGQMLEVARQTTDNPALLALLCEKSAELGAKDQTGYGVAVGALELLIEHAPDKRAEAQSQIVPLRRRLYAAARGDEKKAIGASLIEDYVRVARAKRADADARAAVGAYQNALGVATAIESDRVDELNAAIKDVRSQVALFSTIRKLKAQLKTQPDNAVIAEKLVMTYVIDLDEPDEARKYTFLLKDKALGENVKAASKPLDSVTPDEARSLGQWYHGLAGSAGDNTGKARMLGRAQLYYDHFQLKADKPDSLIALALKDIEATLKTLNVDTTTTIRPDRPSPAGTSVDLLRLVDVDKHVEGESKWKLSEKGLYCPKGKGQRRCRVPVVIGGSYELAVEVTRHSTGHIGIDLPVGLSTVRYYMGYGGHAMFAPIEGHPAYSSKNPTRVKGELAPDTKTLYKFTVKVKGDQCQLLVHADGKQVTKWEGPLAKVGARAEKDMAGAVVFHLSFNGATFHRAKVRMLDGRIKTNR